MSIALPITTEPKAEPRAPARRGYWRRLPPKAKVGAVVLGFFILVAIIGPTIASYNPSYQNPNFNLAMHAPDSKYWLGTTETGQDVFSQLMSGIRLTMVLAGIVGLVATTLSAVIGIAAAFLGGIWDEMLSLLTNVVLVLPVVPLLIILLGYLPQHGQTPTILVLSALSWPWGARVIRAQTLALRNRDFVLAAHETGERGWRIILFDMVPNEISLIAASFVNTVLYAIGASVALAFIGVADLNSWSLGTMLYWAQSEQALTLGAWWWFVPPGLAVALMGMGLVLLNFGIDEIGNPRLRDASAGKALGLGAWSPSNPTLVAFLHSGRRASAAVSNGPVRPGAPELTPVNAVTPGRVSRAGGEGAVP
jgi:peptide/nickel transport system permease protein